MNAYNQFAASSQFYLYGKKHCTSTGYEKHVKSYEQPDILTRDMDLSGKNCLITGANSGVGKEVAQFLASKKATVFMLCRSRARAEAARDEIVGATGNENVFVLVGDVGVEADVRRCWNEFVAQEGGQPQLHLLMCNAGALMNEKTLTSEGVEVTFASHFLFGAYLLGDLAMPALKATPDSRMVMVSSGGMYNSAFPDWSIISCTSVDPTVKYDGQLAYTYAKRGQVLLCERWAKAYPEVKIVSCHPGWTETPAVDAAYGASKSYLEPMRTPWQGAEGIVWLCAVDSSKIESGGFYLDRSTQVKHMAGPFFTEGSHTKNSKGEVDTMMSKLEDWANGRRPKDLSEQAAAMSRCVDAQSAPLQAMNREIDLKSFMGRWYVMANIPTPFDKGTVNNIEEYTYDEAQKTIMVDFLYSDPELTKTSTLKQRATVANAMNTQWKLSPKVGVYLPISIPYLVIDCAEDYSSSIIGVPQRNYVWLMTRVPNPEQSVVDELVTKTQSFGYDIGKLNYVRQEWTNVGTAYVSEAVAEGDEL